MAKSSKRRTQVKDLPEQEKELSKEEQKNVKGGLLPAIQKMRDASANSPSSSIQDGTSNTILIAEKNL